MHVKLQLVVCTDEGREETVMDIVTLQKDCQRVEHLGLTLAEAKQLLTTIQQCVLERHPELSGRSLTLQGLWGRAESQRFPDAEVPHLVWHLQAGQPAFLPLPLPPPQDDLVSPTVLAPHRVSRPRALFYGNEVGLAGLIRPDGGCPHRLSACDPQKPWSRYLLRAYVPVLRLPWGNISGLVHSKV
jgi:hypothetical protein